MPYKTPSTSTPSAAALATYWSRSIRHSRRKGDGSSAWSKAETTTAANTGIGTRAISPSASAINAIRTPPAIRLARRVAAPALSLADAAENPAPTTCPPTAAAARLATPIATSSRLGSTLSPRLSASERIVPQDSTNTINASGMAAEASATQCA
ncbi:hypothetical protein D9M73_151850 [compost metagenome]